MMDLYSENVACPWHFMDYDHKKCLLLGYRYVCGSQQCKEALKNEENNKVDTTRYVRCRG